jgi:hypothetical protein
MQLMVRFLDANGEKAAQRREVDMCRESDLTWWVIVRSWQAPAQSGVGPKSLPDPAAIPGSAGENHMQIGDTEISRCKACIVPCHP